MNKTFLTRIALGLSMLTIAGQVSAQRAPTFPSDVAGGQDNFAKDYVGARLTVTAPAAIAGTKAYELSNDSSSTSEWGGAILSPYINIPVVKAYGPGVDSFGTGALQNGTGSFPSLTGKFALIFRGGNITFTKKAKLCQDAGAIGCIIVNNIPGGPVGMANTPTDGLITIPVIMLSDIDGIAINTQLHASTPVTMSITNWGFNLSHDLGILPNASVLPHAYAIPLSQMGNDNGNPVQYKNQTGAFIGNFGNSTESNVKLKSAVTFTPTGGSTAALYSDSVIVASFPTVDSILIPSVAVTHDPHATTTGRFDFSYQLSQDSADLANGDNTQVTSMYVTDSIYSKSRYDFTNKAPLANVGYLFGSSATGAYTAGPLYHIAKGKYVVNKLQFTISAGSTTATLGGVGSLPINIFKWDDADSNGAMTSFELTLVGTGTKDFSNTDSNFKAYEMKVGTAANTNLPLMLEANADYWIAADVPEGGNFLGCDGVLNYQPRTYVRSRNSSNNSVIENFAPNFTDNTSTLLAADQLIRSIPVEGFSVGTYPDSTSFSIQKGGRVPAIAMILSTSQATSVKNIKAEIGKIGVYPNPASDVVNVSMQLEKSSASVTARITDGMGRTIRSIKRTNVKNDIIQFTTSDLATGQYYIILNTDNGSVARKFAVVAK